MGSYNKQPTHPAYFQDGGVSDVGAALEGMSKTALIDLLLDAFDLLEWKNLYQVETCARHRLDIRGDRWPSGLIRRAREHREPLVQRKRESETNRDGGR